MSKQQQDCGNVVSHSMGVDAELFEELSGEKPELIDDAPDQKGFVKLALAPFTGGIDPLLQFLPASYGRPDITELCKELNKQSKEIAKDDSMERCQKLLASQALTLDAIFNNLAVRATQQTQLKHYDGFMKLALKAQSQTRCTMEAISKIKNPPNATFVKQANYAQGPQQVNNYGNNAPQSAQDAQSSRESGSRADKTKDEPNELLEVSDEERLDFGTKSQASGNDQGVEAVASIDRTKNRTR